MYIIYIYAYIRYQIQYFGRTKHHPSLSTCDSQPPRKELPPFRTSKILDLKVWMNELVMPLRPAVGRAEDIQQK